jgi:hypothetical protein
LPAEFEDIGKLMVLVYSGLDGFTKESEQPTYYKMISNIRALSALIPYKLLINAVQA